MRSAIAACAALCLAAAWNPAAAQTTTSTTSSETSSAASSSDAPQADPSAKGNSAVKDAHPENAGPLAKGANSFTEGQARKHIEKEGYSNVSALTKDENGVWHGTAQKGGETKKVTLDFKGNVVTD